MDKTKKLGILVGLLAVICVIIFAVSRYETKQEKIKNSDAIIAEIDPETVTALSWENETSTLSFTKDGDTWSYDEDDTFPVSEEAMTNLLSIFEEFGASFEIEDVEDYGQYGLDDPEGSVTLTYTDADGAEQTLTVELGDYSKMDSQRYVSIGDDNVYLVTVDPMDYYAIELSAVADNDAVPSFDEIESMTIESGDESYTIHYDAETEGYTAEIDGSTVEMDSSLVSSYLTSLSGLSLTDYTTYNAEDADLTEYGLDEPGITVTVNYTAEDEDGNTSEESFVISLGMNEEDAEALAEQEETEAESTSTEDTEEDALSAYARVADSQFIYAIDTTSYETLMAGLSGDLRHQYVYYGAFSDIAQIDITLDGSAYTFTTETKDDTTTVSYEDEEIEDSAALQSAVTALVMTEFTSEAKEDQGNTEEISMTLTFADGTQQEIVFNRYDGDTCEVIVDGSVLGYASRSSVVSLIEAVNAIVL